MSRPLQTSGMLSRQQLLQLFDDFSRIVSRPDVKKRIEDAVKQKQADDDDKSSCGLMVMTNPLQHWLEQFEKEAVAVTTEIQEELLEQMGVEPKFGIACLGKVNAIYKDDRELMLRFYAFVTKEELACDEAELGSQAFQIKMQQFEKIQDQQLQVLRKLRTLPIKEQQGFLEKLHDHMQHSQYDGGSMMESIEIQEFFRQQQMSRNIQWGPMIQFLKSGKLWSFGGALKQKI
ncbi:hypothetical protein L7F22_061221 [Adiantum nelumboides]|nr:hypothetical protein [Adiantum nelumboides]